MSRKRETESKDKFVEFYLGLEHKSQEGKDESVRIFERKAGEYYTAHGQNALMIADEYYKTRDVIKYQGDDQQLASVTIRPQKVATILKDIILGKQGKAEIWHKNEDTDNWKCIKKGSPGNLQDFDELMGGMVETAVVMAVKLSYSGSQRILGVAFADATLRIIEVCEFDENDRFANFESVLVQKGAKECLIGFDKAATDRDKEKMMAVLSECAIPASPQKLGDFASKNVEQDLARLVGSEHQHLALLELKNGMAAAACLIKYLELLRDESGHGHFRLKSFDLTQYMKLDQAAVAALNLFPQANDSDKNMSLFGLLNKCRTAMGSRLLTQWLKQPLLNLEKIERRLNMVEAFFQDTTMRSALQDEHLKGIPDLDRLAKKFQKGKGDLKDVVLMYQFSSRLPALLSVLQSYEGKHSALIQGDFVAPIQEIVTSLHGFESMVETTINLDAIAKHEYCVNPSFSDELKSIDTRRKAVFRQIEALLSEVASDLDMEDKGVKLNFAANLGYHFRVSRKAEKALRGKKQYTTLETRKDGVRFTTMKMKKLSREHTELSADYDKTQEVVVKKILEIVVTYIPILEKANLILPELDVFVGFAHLAMNAPNMYVRPVMKPMGSGVIDMKKARHPCMEVMDSFSFISNDLQLVKGKSNVQIITGPNMGGKSTYIRQTGVIVLMAQIGCFVPCESATISLMDCVLARVGAGDSQMKGVSTFMKEMLEASAILKTATSNSLIIIDELGRGTSTYDGFGLAWAISEHIATKIQAYALFATHFHELTALADSVPSVVNKHVTAQTTDTSITMLYQVNDGPCDRSFGIHVSELANFPASVVKMAKLKAEQLENFGSAAELLRSHPSSSLSSLPSSPPITADSKEADEPVDGGGPGRPAKRVKLLDQKRVTAQTNSESMDLLEDIASSPSSSSDPGQVSEFMKQFAALPVDSLNDQQLLSSVTQLAQRAGMIP